MTKWQVFHENNIFLPAFGTFLFSFLLWLNTTRQDFDVIFGDYPTQYIKFIKYKETNSKVKLYQFTNGIKTYHMILLIPLEL